MNKFAAKHIGFTLSGITPHTVSTGSIWVYGFYLHIFAGTTNIVFTDNDGNTLIEFEGGTGARNVVSDIGFLADNGLLVAGGNSARILVFHSQDGA